MRVPSPPYEKPEKPIERLVVNKSGRKNMRRQAEAEEFPWHREMDFRQAREDASWDDGIFNPVTLQNMEMTRKANERYMKRVDTEETDRQRRFDHSKGLVMAILIIF